LYLLFCTAVVTKGVCAACDNSAGVPAVTKTGHITKSAVTPLLSVALIFIQKYAVHFSLIQLVLAVQNLLFFGQVTPSFFQCSLRK
jgi:hypothetical protein